MICVETLSHFHIVADVEVGVEVTRDSTLFINSVVDADQIKGYVDGFVVDVEVDNGNNEAVECVLERSMVLIVICSIVLVTFIIRLTGSLSIN